jgi:hypothetical protein
MQNPSTLLTDIVDTLKAIPELSDVLIEAYDTESGIYRNADEAINNFQYATGILAFYEGGSFPRMGEVRGIRHDFSLLLKCQGNNTVSTNLGYFDLLQYIYTGVPAGNCLTFVDTELTGCDPLQDFEHRQLTDADGNLNFPPQNDNNILWFRKPCGVITWLPNEPSYLQLAIRKGWSPIQQPQGSN